MEENMILTRRSLLKGAVAVGALALTGGVSTISLDAAFAQDDGERPFDARNKQFGFFVNASNCSNCGECVRACRKHSATPEDMPSRRKIVIYGDEDNGGLYVSTSCMHCVEPACLKVCPAGAISKGVGGIVSVDGNRCIGCKYCYQACPFSVPHYGSYGMDKCDCCLGNGVKAGDTPYCVRACKFDALHYGLMDDLMAENPDAKRLQGSTDPSMLLA